VVKGSLFKEIAVILFIKRDIEGKRMLVILGPEEWGSILFLYPRGKAVIKQVV
jgi:hypothetical protein